MSNSPVQIIVAAFDDADSAEEALKQIKIANKEKLLRSGHTERKFHLQRPKVQYSSKTSALPSSLLSNQSSATQDSSIHQYFQEPI